MRTCWSNSIAVSLVTLSVLGAVALSASPALATEAPITGPVESITGTTAVFTGELNPGSSEEVAYHFAYSRGEEECTESGRTAPAAPFPDASGEHEEVSDPVTGLEGSTEYTVCLMAADFFEQIFEESTRGTTVTFTTLPAKPAVESEAVSAVTLSSATLEAVVNPENQETTCKGFSYGLTSSYGSNAPCEPEETLGSGSYGERTTARLAGLSANSEYHFRVVAEDATGEAEDVDRTFLTPPRPPTVSTSGASGVAARTASIAGLIGLGGDGHPAQDQTTYYFQYGHTPSYGGQAPLPSGEAGEGEGAIEERAGLVGLEPGTTYHYRIVASNLNNAVAPQEPQVVYGQDETFTTAATPPQIANLAVSAITQNAATITTTLEPQGLPTRWELGLAATTPQGLQPQASGNATVTTPLAITVGSLVPGTTYYYKLTAINENGAIEPEGSFTTASAPAAASPITHPPTPQLLPTPDIAFPEALPPVEHLTNAQKLAKALKACHKDKNKHKRVACDQRAHKRYPPKHKT